MVKTSLFDTVDAAALEELLNAFSMCSGIGVHAFSNDFRIWLKPPSYRRASPFCQLIFAGRQGESRCKSCMKRSGDIAARLGEGYIARCHAGVVEIYAPVFRGDQPVGTLACGPILLWDRDELAYSELIEQARDLVSADALRDAAHAISVLSSGQARAVATVLGALAEKLSQDGQQHIRTRRRLTHQQSVLAGQIAEKKRNQAVGPPGQRVRGAYPIDKEKELLSRVRMGDRSGAREILNDMLSDIFLRTAGNLDMMKARILELVVVISRAAVEGGAELDKLLGLNFEFIEQMAALSDIEEITAWLVRVLEAFMDTVYGASGYVMKNARALSQATRHMREHFSKPLTLETVAREALVSPYYLSHLFKQELGITFIDQLTNIRMQEAARLLLQTDIPIGEIAQSVGYRDTGYFGKLFKRAYGASPNAYRKNNMESAVYL